MPRTRFVLWCGGAHTGRQAIDTQRRGFDPEIVTNALMAVIFAIGQLAIMVTIAQTGRLQESDLISWTFAGYGITGLLSIAFALRFRAALPMAWTIPGAVLIGPALERFAFAEVIGAYWATGLLILLLGLTGWIRRVMDLVPMPIVFGMVAGVFLDFALDIVGAFDRAFWLAIAMVGTYVAVGALAPVARVFPPLLAAVLAGVAVAWGTGTIAPDRPIPFALADPEIYVPRFNPAALIDLVIPLTIAVIGVQNAQGFAIARAKGIAAPENFLTSMCGASTFVLAIFGSVPSCVVGPALAIITGAGRREHWYIGALIFGALFVLIGAFAPTAIALALAVPAELIVTLAGLALFNVLRDSMTTAFAADFRIGALVAFVVTVSGVAPLGIGAAFWGLVLGYAVSRALERDAFRARRASRIASDP
jgi:benzoate membrane transport protein